MSDTVYLGADAQQRRCQYHQGWLAHAADYDIRIPGDSRWANVCEDAYQQVGSPALGTGKGQRLVYEDPPERTDTDIRRDVAAAVEAGDFDALEDIIGDRDFAEFI